MDDILHFERVNAGTPASSNTVRAIDQHQGEDRVVVLWLNCQSLVFLVLYYVIVSLMEHQPCQGV
jgi:hypothetical protein